MKKRHKSEEVKLRELCRKPDKRCKSDRRRKPDKHRKSDKRRKIRGLTIATPNSAMQCEYYVITIHGYMKSEFRGECRRMSDMSRNGLQF